MERGFRAKKWDDGKALRREFDETVHQLRAQAPAVQAYVGQAIMMAGQMFFGDFPGMTDFTGRSPKKRRAYIKGMIDMENKMEREDERTAMAFRLFRLWACATHIQDAELELWFSSALNHFMDLGRVAEGEEWLAMEDDRSRRH